MLEALAGVLLAMIALGVVGPGAVQLFAVVPVAFLLTLLAGRACTQSFWFGE